MVVVTGRDRHAAHALGKQPSLFCPCLRSAGIRVRNRRPLDPRAPLRSLRVPLPPVQRSRSAPGQSAAAPPAPAPAGPSGGSLVAPHPAAPHPAALTRPPPACPSVGPRRPSRTGPLPAPRGGGSPPARPALPRLLTRLQRHDDAVSERRLHKPNPARSDVIRLRALPRACALIVGGGGGVALEAWREQPGERMRMHLRRPGAGPTGGRSTWFPGCHLFWELLSVQPLFSGAFVRRWGCRGEEAPGFSEPTANSNILQLLFCPPRGPLLREASLDCSSRMRFFLSEKDIQVLSPGYAFASAVDTLKCQVVRTPGWLSP